MVDFSQVIVSLKTEEADAINRTAKNFFLGKIPLSFSVRMLDKSDLDAISALQSESAKKGALRQNKKKELTKSLEEGVWIGVFNDKSQLEAYTAFELEYLEGNILLYLKATAKREGKLKGFQKQTIELRRKLGGNLAEKSMLPFGGGYATCQPANTRCVDNLMSSGMHRLFHIKGLYGESPQGDRDIFGYGDIFELKELLFDKWTEEDIWE